MTDAGCPSCATATGSSCGGVNSRGEPCAATSGRTHRNCHWHLPPGCVAFEDAFAAEQEAKQQQHEAAGRRVVEAVKGLPIHVWRHFPLLHVVTGSLNRWHLVPVGHSGRTAYPIEPESFEQTITLTNGRTWTIPDDIIAKSNELARLGAMVDCDLSEFPAAKLALPIWSSTTLCKQTWNRVATQADKDELLSESGSWLTTAVCGRCAA